MTAASVHENFMQEALREAEAGLAGGDVPIGAVLVGKGEVVGRSHWSWVGGDLLAHSEMLVLRATPTRGASLYTTIEPCVMCMGAAMSAFIETVVFSIPSPTDGAGHLPSSFLSRMPAAGRPWSMPQVVGGVCANSTWALIETFLRSASPGPLTDWAKTLIDKRETGLEETYVSLDLEVDGEAPGLSSMLSLGAAAVRDGRVIATFAANLSPLPGAQPHAETMRWWSRFPDEYALATKNARPPEEVMVEFVDWLRNLGAARLVAVGAPACYDFAFVNYYCHRFVGSNPLGYSCLDILSLAMGRLGARAYWDLEYKIDEVLRRQSDPTRRRHVAVDDAVLQAETLIALLALRP